jgi:hypothetical protein
MASLKPNTLYKYAYSGREGPEQEVVFYRTKELDTKNKQVYCELLFNMSSGMFKREFILNIDGYWSHDSDEITEEHMELYKAVYT